MIYVLALALVAPFAFGARLGPLVESLVDAGRLPAGSQCSAALASVPVSLVLQPDADAAELLAEVADARWERSGKLTILARSPQLQRVVEQRQSAFLRPFYARVLEESDVKLRRAQDHPDAYGRDLLAQQEEARRTRGGTPVQPLGPIQLLALGLLVDVGADRLSGLDNDAPIYLCNVREGVHEPFGKDGLRTLQTFREVMRDVTVQDALQRGDGLNAILKLDPQATDSYRYVGWIARHGMRLTSLVRVYDAAGKRLALNGTFYAVPPAPVSLPVPDDALVEPSPLSGLLSERWSKEGTSAPSAQVQSALLDRERSPTVVLGDDVALALSRAFPGRSVAMLLDEAWIKDWIRLFGADKVPLKTALSVVARGGGLDAVLRDRELVVRPNLQRDAELNAGKPEAVEAFVRAALSPGGLGIADRCVLAREKGIAMLMGSEETLRWLAESPDDRFRDDEMFDHNLLAVVAGLLPLPTAEHPVRASAGAPIRDMNVVRKAMSSMVLSKTLASQQAPDVLQCGSFYKDGEIASMPWEIRFVPATFYSYVLEGGKKRVQRRNEIVEWCCGMLKNGSMSLEALRAYPVYRGEGARYELSVRIAPGATWATSLGEHADWPAKPTPLGESPEGKAILDEVLKLVKPPPR